MGDYGEGHGVRGGIVGNQGEYERKDFVGESFHGPLGDGVLRRAAAGNGAQSKNVGRDEVSEATKSFHSRESGDNCAFNVPGISHLLHKDA